jgi:anti-anti-sigma regulatory factor
MSEKPVIVQKLPGRITSEAARSIFRDVEPSLQGSRPRVVFDFSDVRGVDVKGVFMLLRCLEIVMKENGDLKLAAIPQQPDVLTAMSRLDGLFETFETTSAAVDSFRTFSKRDMEFNPHLFSTDQAGASSSVCRSTDGMRSKLANHLLARLVSAIVVVAILASSSAGQAVQQEAPASQEHPADPAHVQPVAPAPETSSPQSQTAPSDQPSPAPPSTNTEPNPDSPGTVRSQAPAQQQPADTTPVGTAAAELTTTSGVAASRPAGAAFAPAKQHRVRTIVISMGAILGAGIAIGTVAALSQGSPSKPPGAH